MSRKKKVLPILENVEISAVAADIMAYDKRHNVSWCLLGLHKRCYEVRPHINPWACDVQRV